MLRADAFPRYLHATAAMLSPWRLLLLDGACFAAPAYASLLMLIAMPRYVFRLLPRYTYEMMLMLFCRQMPYDVVFAIFAPLLCAARYALSATPLLYARCCCHLCYAMPRYFERLPLRLIFR